MEKGLLMLAWVFLISMLLQKSELETTEHIICDNYSIKRSTKKYAVLLFLVPLIFTGFKTAFADTESYIATFNKLATQIPFEEALKRYPNNQLFYALMYGFKKFISSDATTFFFTLTLIQSILLVGTLRNFSENLGISIYVFVASAMVFSWMCNGIRQFLAVTILFALTNCFLKNKWFVYLPAALFLGGLTPFFKFMGWDQPFWLFTGIHQSALIVIPIFFIVRGKALTKKVWILLVALLVITMLGLLDTFLESSTQNTMYANDLSYISNDKGTNPIRFLVSLGPIFLVIAKQETILKDEPPAIINLSINMSFVSSTLYLASVFTSGIFIGRLPIYCELYSLILIPWLINHMYEKSRKYLTASLYILYFLYFLYQIFIAWSDMVYTVKVFGLEF